ncbi:hypothetical protein NQZ68_000998 [Dissostichus eleginoides]|nr:hypothetical protein NQZ68_000998 [Dissostichus eleginoides]
MDFTLTFPCLYTEGKELSQSPSSALEQERERGSVWGGGQDRRDWEIGGGGARGGGANVSFHWLPIHQGSVYRCAGRQQHRKNKAQHQSPLQGHHSSRGEL